MKNHSTEFCSPLSPQFTSLTLLIFFFLVELHNYADTF